MSIADMMLTLASRLNSVLNNINAKLEEKGADKAKTFGDIEASIESIKVGDDTTIPQTSAATAQDILSPKQAWVNGEQITGEIQTKTSGDITVSGATITVPSGYYGTQASKSVATGSLSAPTISVSSGGVVTASSGIATPGYISSGTKSNTYSIATQAGTTITPNTYTQTAVSSGRYTTGTVYVGAIPSDYVKPTVKQSGGTISLSPGESRYYQSGTYLTSALNISALSQSGGYDLYWVQTSDITGSDYSNLYIRDFGHTHGSETPAHLIVTKIDDAGEGIRSLTFDGELSSLIYYRDSSSKFYYYDYEPGWLSFNWFSSEAFEISSSSSNAYRQFNGEYMVYVAYPRSSSSSGSYSSSDGSMSISVQNISGAQYNFKQTAPLFIESNIPDVYTNYYSSTNQSVNNSYSICRVYLNCPVSSVATIFCKCGGERNYDYGIIGNLNQALSLSSSADSNYAADTKSIGSESSSDSNYNEMSIIDMEIPSGGGWFDIKYIKDSSNSYGDDTFTFRVELDKK